MVRRLLKGRGMAVVVLGSGHDLRDNVPRLGDGRGAYVRVTPKGHPDAEPGTQRERGRVEHRTRIPGHPPLPFKRQGNMKWRTDRTAIGVVFYRTPD
jgi:hypothetical protein